MWIEINHQERYHLLNFDNVENIFLDYDEDTKKHVAIIYQKSTSTKFWFGSYDEIVDFFCAIRIAIRSGDYQKEIVNGYIRTI